VQGVEPELTDTGRVDGVFERPGEHLGPEADPQVRDTCLDRRADEGELIRQERVPVGHIDVHRAAVQDDAGDPCRLRELAAGPVLDPLDP
jgi:hypothetical protein